METALFKGVETTIYRLLTLAQVDLIRGIAGLMAVAMIGVVIATTRNQGIKMKQHSRRGWVAAITTASLLPLTVHRNGGEQSLTEKKA